MVLVGSRFRSWSDFFLFVIGFAIDSSPSCGAQIRVPFLWSFGFVCLFWWSFGFECVPFRWSFELVFLSSGHGRRGEWGLYYRLQVNKRKRKKGAERSNGTNVIQHVMHRAETCLEGYKIRRSKSKRVIMVVMEW